jgi:hypothetical protein
MSLKERSSETKTGAIVAFLAAITVIGTIGLGITFGGVLTLSKEAHLGEDIIGLFMLLTLAIVGVVEFLLIRQLSKLLSSTERRSKETHSASVMPHELGPGHPRTLPEPIPSVTENTTRTLEYSRKDSAKQ